MFGVFDVETEKIHIDRAVKFIETSSLSDNMNVCWPLSSRSEIETEDNFSARLICRLGHVALL